MLGCQNRKNRALGTGEVMCRERKEEEEEESADTPKETNKIASDRRVNR